MPTLEEMMDAKCAELGEAAVKQVEAILNPEQAVIWATVFQPRLEEVMSKMREHLDAFAQRIFTN
jgi:hypothetical protein